MGTTMGEDYLDYPQNVYVFFVYFCLLLGTCNVLITFGLLKLSCFSF